MKLRGQLHKSFRSAVTTFECWAQDGAPEETAHTNPSEWQTWDLWPTEAIRVVCSAGIGTDLSFSTSVHMFLLCRVKSAMTKALSVC